MVWKYIKLNKFSYYSTNNNWILEEFGRLEQILSGLDLGTGKDDSRTLYPLPWLILFSFFVQVRVKGVGEMGRAESKPPDSTLMQLTLSQTRYCILFKF